MKRVLATIALSSSLLALAPVVQAQERRQIPEYREVGIAPESSIREELFGFLQKYQDAWSREDTNAFIALHTEDTEWINAYARMFTDSKSLAEFLETRLFPAFKPAVSKLEAENMELISMRVLSETVAVLHLFTDGDRGPSAIKGRSQRRTHFHLVLSREAEGWKVEHTAIMDARG